MSDIKGYRELTAKEVEFINSIKEQETKLGLFYKDLQLDPNLEADPRWFAMAKTYFEKGFMALCRSVAKPEERF